MERRVERVIDLVRGDRISNEEHLAAYAVDDGRRQIGPALDVNAK